MVGVGQVSAFDIRQAAEILFGPEWARAHVEDADAFEDADAERYQRETHGPIYAEGAESHPDPIGRTARAGRAPAPR